VTQDATTVLSAGAGQSRRLPAGGRIDRNIALPFQFNNKQYFGFSGDTLASALLANNVRLIARSVKFHRPRGILSAGVEEPNALVEVDVGSGRVPLVRATLQPLVSNLKARSSNAFPSVNWDLGRLIDFTRALWPAGFYNKTFKWPSWHWYEWLIRRVAGPGRLLDHDDPTRYFHHNLHCDVLVVGAGPAGLSAALAAADLGADVVIVEQDRALGGSLLFDAAVIDGLADETWLDRVINDLEQRSTVTIMRCSTVVGYYDGNVLTVCDRSDAAHADGPVERIWRVRAREVILATGAIEQPLVFPNNDRPGVMLASAVRHYIGRYAVTPGRRVVVATNNDDAWATAFMLLRQGIEVPILVDARTSVDPGLVNDAARQGLAVQLGSVVMNTRGASGVKQVTIGKLSADGKSLDSAQRVVSCDCVAMSGGWAPSVHLFCQAGGRLRYSERIRSFVPDSSRQRVRVTGAANGIFELSLAIKHGTAAGERAVRGNESCSKSQHQLNRVSEDRGYTNATVRRTPSADPACQWVDFAHDVTVADIELAARENLRSIEHVKRYTTVGMSMDQGKTSNLNASSMLAELTNRHAAEVGTTSYRPLFVPVSMGAIAGARRGILYAPARRMPAHEWHAAHGAHFEDYAGWQRPAFFGLGTETCGEAIHREVLAQRSATGIFDGSPLGKIEVVGPDAAQFLNRIYVNNMLTLQPGRIRYGLMLDENGVVLDDGVLARLADDRFLISTTSANAQRIFSWLEQWLQCEWPHLRVIMTDVTEQWAVLTLAGPQVRKVLSSLDGDIDFSNAAFPHMRVCSGTLEDVPARVQRVSFSGELSFEIAVPADATQVLFDALENHVRSSALTPIGIEALSVMRMEKGYFHIGADTDGTSNAYDCGFGEIVRKKGEEFVGSRSLRRPFDQDDNRRQLVGLEFLDHDRVPCAGAHLVENSGRQRRSVGVVTSACHSPTLGRPIGLGLLEGGRLKMGMEILTFDEGRSCRARVAPPCFFDPDGLKQNV
jgi:sarcosine oxidase, subunit alpha